MIEIKNIHVVVEGKPILKGLSLTLRPGEIHAVMGPNGAGKSTLAKVLAGHPSYEVVQGEVWFAGQNILDLEPEERARLGLFLGFQYPVEIAGISNIDFLRSSYQAMRKARSGEVASEEEFSSKLEEKLLLMDMKKETLLRNINEGFSGGEKKRNEILQMAMLEPTFSILDETDSGLDIDAMKVVAKGVNALHHSGHTLLLITHYQRLLDYIRPDFVHVVIDGVIAKSGGPELAAKLEEEGYDWLINPQEEQVGC